MWSDASSWPSGKVPVEGDEVEIPTGTLMILDVDTPVLNSLLINGRLEFDENAADLTLNAKLIHVFAGSFGIGSEEKPFAGQATVMLHGFATDPSLYMGVLLEAGNKVIGVNGLVEFYGQSRSRHSRLTQTVYSGSTSFFVEPDLDWTAGDEIVLFPTAI